MNAKRGYRIGASFRLRGDDGVVAVGSSSMDTLQGVAMVQGTQLEQPRVRTITETADVAPIQGLTRRGLMRAGGGGWGGGAGGGERLSLMQRVLAARGLNDPAECERFQSPRL